MIEIAIAFSGVSNKTIDCEKMRLHSVVRDLGGIFTTLIQNDVLYFLIASKQNEDIIREEITKSVCLCIKDFKTQYIIKHLKFRTKNELKFCTLLKALANFDKRSDDKIIRYKVRLKDEFNICSFYKFCLPELREKWQQLIEITNQNIGFLGFEDTYIDIIRFLVDGITIGEELKAEKIDNTLFVYNKDNELLAEYIFDVEKLMELLISHNPCSLYVSGFNDDMNSFLSILFEGRVKII